jgi:hypothetical protein
VKHWLIVYDRTKGELLRCTEYRSDLSGELAILDRFAVERAHPELEVVVLGGDSLDTIKRTHSRYFANEAAPPG